MYRLRKAFRGLVLVSIVIAVACTLVFLIIAAESGRLPLGRCMAGSEGVAEGASGEAKKLLGTRNFEASANAIGDLKAGIVDKRLVATLQTVAEEHRICVDAFKEGHYFLPGVKDGPLIPDSYGEAGGLPNTHYYGRAADIRRVDGRPVQGNGDDPDILDVGRTIAGIPSQQRPDQIIGPKSWVEALDHSRGEGWILDDDQLALHDDHLHLGYTSDSGTLNTQ